MRTGIFPVICTGNVPTQDEVIFPDHCLYGCGGKESSHIGCRGAKLVKSSDVRLFHVEQANQSHGSTEDVYGIGECMSLYLNTTMLFGGDPIVISIQLLTFAN